MAIQHFSQMVQRQAEKLGERTAYSFKERATKSWVAVSWNKFSQQVKNFAKVLADMGVKEQENIATYIQNKPEGVITDFAAYRNRAVVVPLYATSSRAQIEYIINEAEVALLIVGDQQQYNNGYEAMKNCPTLRQLVVVDADVKLAETDTTTLYFSALMERGATLKNDAVVEERANRATEADLGNIIYTSGTTGEPKGVMLTHENFATAMRIHRKRLTMVTDKDVSLCFLPMAHIFERAWTYYCFYMGVQVVINEDPKVVQDTLAEVRPTIMCSVPRFWEKVYAAVQEKVNATHGVAGALLRRAVVVGKRHNLDYVRREKRAPFLLAIEYKFYSKVVFSKLKKAVGIEHGNVFPVAGAPLSDTINEFLQACGIRVLYGYGLSETTATVTCFNTVGYELGTVGTTMPGVQVKIGENDEVLIKGGTVMKGYYKKPEETAKVFTEDGWFRSGDAGKINRDGALVLTERIKDLFKTSNGKYIAPQALETKIGEDKYIDQVAVIGNNRKYVTAIIIPAYEALKEYAAQMHIKYQSIEELVKNQEIHALIEERLNELQKNFASFERVKKFTLLPIGFSMESGELTNTLKLRRPIINKRYSKEIEAMYC